ncbi:hypothetical protein ACFQDG_02720 [Natronoarchaeum mannanilyticum]|uniref:DUF8144 domain-containing protein n=1 Tax=Natronoarchaeum mannanilyticum TaxID=926360 RepID=A0AAV3TCD3_9EURY
MEQNPVEDNFVTRFLLGAAVIFAMSMGGAAAAELFRRVGMPYGAWVGTLVGAIAAFVAFAILYRRYDESFEAA